MRMKALAVLSAVLATLFVLAVSATPAQADMCRPIGHVDC